MSVLAGGPGVSQSLAEADGALQGGGIAPSAWLFDGGATIQLGTIPGGGAAANATNYNRAAILLAVSGGDVKVAYGGAWHATTNGTNALHTTARVIRSAVNNFNVYFADGTNWKYYDPNDNTVKAWTATAGTLPVDEDGNLPRLIETWRGRTVLAGLQCDSSNWFMSKVNDPHDWDYAPLSPSPIDAVAGNNADQGKPSDVITGLCAYSDDVLIFFGDHTIWLMQGDPLAGGQIDRVSDQVGGIWGVPWCKGPDGAVYFMANLMAVFRMVPGSLPERISQPIEPDLKRITPELVVIRLCWEDRTQGLHVLITPHASAQPATHYFWEQRTGAWWQDEFTEEDHSPLCCLAFPGITASDRAVLIGSWDGYVRYFTPDAPNDDGEGIASDVFLGPIVSKDLDEFLLKDVQAVLADTSGPVTWAVHVGATAEAALAGSAVESGLFEAGRSLTQPVRRSGHACYVRLTGLAPWATEFIRGRFAGRGKVRRRSY